ncbi:MAG: hypothetical protein J2P37_29070, partial [Ktedonobacteraceae bacterium]|nr:hypothetical protein [Ktedonobacteraceae bacterium]
SHRMGLVAQWEHPLACWLRDSLLALTPPQMLLKPFKPVASSTWESSCEPARAASLRERVVFRQVLDHEASHR